MFSVTLYIALLSFKGAQDHADLLCCQSSLLAPVYLAIHKDPQILSSRAPPQPIRSQPMSLEGFFPLKCKTLQLSLLNFLRFLLAHFSSMSRLLWMKAQPLRVLPCCPNFVSLENLTRVQLSPPGHWQKSYWTGPKMWYSPFYQHSGRAQSINHSFLMSIIQPLT